MAYMNQEKKAQIKKALDAIVKGTDIKYTLAVRNHSTIVCTITKSSLDFFGNFNSNNERDKEGYIQVNHYYIEKNFSGECLEILQKMLKALNDGNFDKSDIQSDYFHVGWYVDLNIGKWEKPYQLVEYKQAA